MDLKIRIKNRGLKQNFVAKKVGIKESILSRYLKGDRKIPEDIYKKIVNLLDSTNIFLNK